MAAERDIVYTPVAKGVPAIVWGDLHLLSLGIGAVLGAGTVVSIIASGDEFQNAIVLSLGLGSALFFGSMFICARRMAERSSIEAIVGYTTMPYAHRELPEIDWRSGGLLRAPNEPFLSRTRRRELRRAIRAKKRLDQ